MSSNYHSELEYYYKFSWDTTLIYCTSVSNALTHARVYYIRPLYTFQYGGKL